MSISVHKSEWFIFSFSSQSFISFLLLQKSYFYFCDCESVLNEL